MDFQFANREVGWAIFGLVPLLIVMWKNALWREKMALIFAQNGLQEGFRFTWYACFILGWLFAVLAWMRPQGNEKYQIVEGIDAPPQEVYLLVDVSQSMAVRDMTAGMSRLEMAKEILQQVVLKLPHRAIALFAFSGQLTPLVPATYDQFFLLWSIQQLVFNEGNSYGTHLYEALKELNSHLIGHPLVVLLSDGGDETRSLSASPFAGKLMVVGVGSTEGGEVPGIDSKKISRLEQARLEALGGKYLSAEGRTPLFLAQAIERQIEQENSQSVQPGLVGKFEEYFFYPLAVACLFFLGFLLKPQGVVF